MPARNNAGQNQQEPAWEECNEFTIKTHVDGDFRFPKPALTLFGFGNKAELKVKILDCAKSRIVKLSITKA